METEDIVEVWHRNAVREGIEQGIEQGVRQGVERGLARALVLVYTSRFGTMPQELRAIVESTEDEQILAGWMELVGTHSAGEMAAAIRAARTS